MATSRGRLRPRAGGQDTRPRRALTADTHHVVDAAALASMKPDALLINAARGGVVDEAAMADALRAGRLGGAALDVFETEPLTEQDARRFAGLPDLVLTPTSPG